MSLWKIAWRSIEQRALASWLTGLSMALGVALVVSVLVIHSVVSETFSRTAQGYDLIVGAKGGGLQLVLNTVFHLSRPINNIPYSYYKEFTADEHRQGKYARYVKLAIPYCLGDSYKDYRVVGTTPQMFDEFEYAKDRKYQFAKGRNFKHENFFEGVIGSLVARQTGLKVGDQFNPTHGVTDDNLGHKPHDPFTVVGILAPTGTPNDRALFVNMEGFYLLEKHAKDPPAKGAANDEHEHDEHADHDHEHEAGHDEVEHHEEGHSEEGHNARADEAHDHGHADHEHEHAPGTRKPLPEDQREVTAILLRTKLLDDPVAAMTLPGLINDEPLVQAVAPTREILILFDSVVKNVRLLLVALAVLVVVVAAIGIMVSIYNSMNDRRRDIAIMRSLGARRTTVMVLILLESFLLSLGGCVAGELLGHAIPRALSPWIVAQTGVTVGFFQFHWTDLDFTVMNMALKLSFPTEPVLVPALVAMATLAGFLPAITAYRTDVAKALSLAP